jgi:hypothetical protein
MVLLMPQQCLRVEKQVYDLRQEWQGYQRSL